jgi:antitoxin HigA-1
LWLVRQQENAVPADLGIRMKNPPHVGGFVRHEILEPLGLNVTVAAKALGVTRPALSGLLNEHVALSPEMALRIEKAFGVSMDVLMRMQNSYDIAKARGAAKGIKVKRWLAAA